MMSTPLAHFGFNFEKQQSESDNNNQSRSLAGTTTSILSIPSVSKRINNKMGKKKRIVNGRVKIRLGKKKVVSLTPSTLIGHIPNTKLKAAAKSAIRQQASGLNRPSRKGKKKGRKGKKKKSKTANIIV